jgi:hypothetical protein
MDEINNNKQHRTDKLPKAEHVEVSSDELN